MDYTPFRDISDLSECLTRTSESSGYESRSYISSYSETPTTSQNVSRKRKFSQFCISERRTKIQKEVSSVSPFETNQNLYFLSSTLNESLSNKLEKCSISTYTPQFYVERSPSEFEDNSSSKRQRVGEEGEHSPKTQSAPSTPTKQIGESTSISKCKSENLENNFNWTPCKNNIPKPLGSPERAEILYPNILQNTTPRRLVSPQKFIESLKKLNSPAKKRLFKSTCRDPIKVFQKEKCCPKIISLIFSFLTEEDLYHVNMVSKVWKSALLADRKAYDRYIKYVDEYRSNKENFLHKLTEDDTNISPPCSPQREKFQKCIKIASTLSSSQSLSKCLKCMQPAIMEKNVGQCQNIRCEYIWCRNCLSFSTTGPANFYDKCCESELVLDNQNRRRSFMDISNVGVEDLPSFLLDSSLRVSTFKCDSSGYLSENEFNSPSIKQNLSPTFVGKNKSNILKDCNRNVALTQKKTRRSSLVPVIDSSTPKIIDVIEPSSPPKVKNVACSRQSKKNLKRLKF